MKLYKHRYFGTNFEFDTTTFKVGDIIHIYLASDDLEDFKLKLELTGVTFKVIT